MTIHLLVVHGVSSCFGSETKKLSHFSHSDLALSKVLLRRVVHEVDRQYDDLEQITRNLPAVELCLSVAVAADILLGIWITYRNRKGHAQIPKAEGAEDASCSPQQQLSRLAMSIHGSLRAIVEQRCLLARHCSTVALSLLLHPLSASQAWQQQQHTTATSNCSTTSAIHRYRYYIQYNRLYRTVLLPACASCRSAFVLLSGLGRALHDRVLPNS